MNLSYLIISTRFCRIALLKSLKVESSRYLKTSRILPFYIQLVNQPMQILTTDLQPVRRFGARAVAFAQSLSNQITFERLNGRLERQIGRQIAVDELDADSRLARGYRDNSGVAGLQRRCGVGFSE